MSLPRIFAFCSPDRGRFTLESKTVVRNLTNRVHFQSFSVFAFLAAVSFFRFLAARAAGSTALPAPASACGAEAPLV
jgi:hypothetical protein